MSCVDTVLQWGEFTLPESVLGRSNSFLIQSWALQRSCGFSPQHSTRLAVYTPGAPALCSVCLGCADFSRNTNTCSSRHSQCVTQAGTCHGRVCSLFRHFPMSENSVLATWAIHSVLLQQHDRHPLWLEAKLDRLVSETSIITENTLLAAISVCDIGEGVFTAFCFSEEAK